MRMESRHWGGVVTYAAPLPACPRCHKAVRLGRYVQAGNGRRVAIHRTCWRDADREVNSAGKA
jgi:hypothetical protein